MLNYAAGEYGEYCDACQAAITVIRSSDAALKSCLEWLMSYIIGDSAYFSVQFCRQTDMDWPGNVCTHRPVLGTGIRTTRLILARPHTSKAVLLHYITPSLGPAPALCIPGVAVLAVLAVLARVV